MRMSRYSRRGRARQSGEKNSFWLSFSDLMSALVLVIILVLFYILYPVSYTHLDVYKRQLQHVAAEKQRQQRHRHVEHGQRRVAQRLGIAHGPQRDGRRRARQGDEQHQKHVEKHGEELGRHAAKQPHFRHRVGIVDPVSYTHLDVYKRQ